MNKAYHGGGGLFNVTGTDFADIERSNEAVNADGLDAWFDPSPKAISKLSNFLTFSVKTSPPVHADGLVETISKLRNIPKENIIVAGGSSDLMFALFPNLNCNKALILDPMYGEYQHIFENVLENTHLDRYILSLEKDFAVEMDDFINIINESKPNIVVIVNPNSPTGKFIEKNNILKIVENIPKETLFIVDETYIDYVDSKESVETHVKNYENLLVIKSMSKVYSLSGARVGYLVAPKLIAEKINKYIPPFSVSTGAQILAIEALKDVEYYKGKWGETKKLRQDLVDSIISIPDIKVYFGEGNFILIQLLGNKTGKAEQITANLTDKNIFIRNADSMSKQFNGSFLRIAVKDSDTNSKIIEGLKKVL